MPASAAPVARTPLQEVVRLGGGFAAANVARMVLGLLSALALARGLGPDAFGRWTLWSAWAAALTSAFDVGLGALVTRDAAQEPSAAGRLVGGAIAIRLALFAPAAAAIWALVPDTGRSGAPGLVVLLTGAGLAYGGIASGFRSRPALVPAVLFVETGGAVLACAGAAVVALRRLPAAAMLAVAIAVQLVQIAAALAVWRGRPETPPLSCPPPADAWRLLRRAWPFAAAGLVANGQARVAPLLLGALAAPSELALFGAASRIVDAVKSLPQAMFAGALPVLTAEAGAEAAAPRRHDRPGPPVDLVFQARVRQFAVGAAVVLAVLAYPLVRVTFGLAYAPAWRTLVWLAVGLLPTLTNSARKVALYAANRERPAVRWSGVALSLQLALGAVAIPWLGAPGAALALAAGEWAVRRPLARAGAP